MSSISGSYQRCSSCGKTRELSHHYLGVPETEGGLLCPQCIWRLEQGETVTEIFYPGAAPSGKPEEAFKEVFAAGRTLLKKRIEAESQIVPTLVAALEIAREAKNWTAIKEQVLSEGPEAFWQRPIVDGIPLFAAPRHWRVTEVVDDILILETLPVSARAVKTPPGRPPPNSLRRLEAISIRAYPYERLATVEEIATAYENALWEGSASRWEEVGKRAQWEARRPDGWVPYKEGYGLRLDGEFTGKYLELIVSGKDIWRSTSPNPPVSSGFPPPRLVGKLVRAYLEEFSGRLITRKAGAGIGHPTLTLACVAFLLRASGGIKPRREVHRLLNDEVYKPVAGRQVLPDDPLDDPSATNAFWESVRKAGSAIHRGVETSL